MHRNHLCCALVHALLVAATVSADDGVPTTSFASQGTFLFGSDSVRQATGTSQVSSALLPGIKPLDGKVSEYIASTSNRVFGPTAAANRNAELAALIHPLAQPVQPLQRWTLDWNLGRTSALNALLSPGFVSPTDFQSSQTLFAPAILSMPTSVMSISQYR